MGVRRREGGREGVEGREVVTEGRARETTFCVIAANFSSIFTGPNRVQIGPDRVTCLSLTQYGKLGGGIMQVNFEPQIPLPD